MALVERSLCCLRIRDHACDNFTVMFASFVHLQC